MTSEIKFEITLDEKKIPEKIFWSATDAEYSVPKPADTILISLWDPEEKVTLGIDLWTKNMLIDDINILYHQTFIKMADSYGRATNNYKISELIRGFADQFAEQLSLLQKPEEIKQNEPKTQEDQ